MNRLRCAILSSCLFAVFAFSAQAQDAPAKPDPAKGEALYLNGDMTRGIPSCASCHGSGGNSTIAQNPSLAQQGAPYIVKQLHDFASGARANAIMSIYAKALKESEIRDLAAYVSIQPAKPGAAKNKDTIELGKAIYRGGIADRRVPACAACHGPRGNGLPNQFPRIAGQHQEYTVAQLNNFSDADRKNGPMMMTIANRMSQQEIKAVADYIAGLK